MSRIEVTFNDGTFRAFPHVRENTFIEQDGWIKFSFGKAEVHQAALNTTNINFMEEMKEEAE